MLFSAMDFLKHITGKQLKYIGVGEKITDIELFHPERIANKYLEGLSVTFVENLNKIFLRIK